MTEPVDLSSLPYRDRRFLCIAADKLVKHARKVQGGPIPAERQLEGLYRLGELAAAALGGGNTQAISDALILGYRTANFWWSLQHAQTKGVFVLLASNSEAEPLRFPVGHPRDRVLYVGHPFTPDTYVPMASFHRFLFEHKVAEALRLLRTLGAVDVEVEHITGWRSTVEAGAEISVPLIDGVDIGGKVAASSGENRRVISRMKLAPSTDPYVPNDLVWYQHEPLWREVADARLESGLTSFQVDVEYTEDFGVNSSVKTIIAKTGLEIGGAFSEHQKTIWRLKGSF